MAETIADRIRHLSPCGDALAWAAGYADPATAWAECQRGDWMLWLLGRTVQGGPWSDARKPLLACCLDCALTVRHLWPQSQAAKIDAAVGVLRSWIGGTASLDQARQARRDLSSAADAYAYAYASAAAAAYAAAYAAEASAYAAEASAARKKNLAECAAIVCRHFPDPPTVATKE